MCYGWNCSVSEPAYDNSMTSVSHFGCLNSYLFGCLDPMYSQSWVLNPDLDWRCHPLIFKDFPWYFHIFSTSYWGFPMEILSFHTFSSQLCSAKLHFRLPAAAVTRVSLFPLLETPPRWIATRGPGSCTFQMVLNCTHWCVQIISVCKYSIYESIYFIKLWLHSNPDPCHSSITQAFVCIWHILRHSLQDLMGDFLTSALQLSSCTVQFVPQLRSVKTTTRTEPALSYVICKYL